MKKPGAAPAPAPEPESEEGKAEAEKEAAKPEWMSLDEDDIYKWNWEQARTTHPARTHAPPRIPHTAAHCALRRRHASVVRVVTLACRPTAPADRWRGRRARPRR